jgi:hypothetical protein
VVVRIDQFDEGRPIDQPQIGLHTLECPGIVRERAKRDEKPMLSVFDCTVKLLHIWAANRREDLLALHLNNGRLKSEFVAVCDYVDSTVARSLRHAAVIPHAL